MEHILRDTEKYLKEQEIKFLGDSTGQEREALQMIWEAFRNNSSDITFPAKNKTVKKIIKKLRGNDEFQITTGSSWGSKVYIIHFNKD